jgi:stage V sporulation protein B
MLHFGKGYEILLFGAFTLILTAIMQIQTALLQSLNRLYFAIVSLSVGLVIKLIINYTLIANPSIRIYGALIGTYFSLLVTIIMNAIILRKQEKLRVSIFRELSKPAFSSLIMAVVVAMVYFSQDLLAMLC